MNIRLSHEELDILNLILPFINPRDDSFNVGNLHAINILRDKFPNGNGGVDLAKYDPFRKDLIDRGIYSDITKWLIQQDFTAIVSSISNVPNALKLTRIGEILWAYGDCLTYYSSYDNVDSEGVDARVTHMISNVPSFGEFELIQKEPKVRFLDINFLYGDPDKSLKKVNDIVSGKTGLIEMHEQYLIDEKAMDYLVEHGFATNRFDPSNGGKNYRQLTEKGRTLKELGSVDKYDKKIAVDKERSERIIRENDEVRRANIISGKIQQNLLAINKWIALAGIVAAVYYATLWFDYFANLIRTHPSHYYSQSATAFLIILGCVLGATTTVAVLQIRKAIKKRQPNTT